ncbi:hypothetical protein AKJ09_10202 [Labilithrix luteola]|uniref:Secreted protein n=1 Tax=Labilithrix luteola TaxID=1391654 RepID=A0A0K1QCR3_9BACT|nr:hypothetical protein [Labilithrix luteola]AKV03539.1 hypothetical protein AKJ09_10202 [Labilithrix luteola]
MIRTRSFAGSALPRWAPAAVALCTLSTVACSKCGHHETPTDETVSSAPPSPVPAPEALLADLYVTSPNGSWAKLQRGIGGATGILPPSAGGIVCTALGLDPSLGGEIDGTLPSFGVVAGDPASPGWAFAMKLTDARHARSVLAGGDTAHFTSREADGMTVLAAKGESPDSSLGLAISSNGYLLVARKGDDLTRLGPYLTRTLPSRPLPPGALVADVPRSALASVIAPKLRSLWAETQRSLLAQDDQARRAHGGRAPDFADPKAILAAADTMLGRRLDIVGDLDRLRLSLDVGDEGTVISATMTPAAGGGAASKWITAMRTGDHAPIDALPASAAVALLLRDGDEARAEQARELEEALRASLGERLAAADGKKLHEVFDDGAKARSDVLTASVLWDEPQAFALQAPVKDAEAAGRAVRGALDLARAAPFKEMLHLDDATTASEETPDLGRISLATFVRKAHGGGASGASGLAATGRPKALPTSDAGAKSRSASNAGGAMAWSNAAGQLSVVLGAEPVVGLRTNSRPDKTLGAEPSVKQALEPLGSEASTVVVVQPLRFDPTRANLPIAPVVFAVGRHGGDAFARLSLSNGVLREVARRQMGF